MLHFRMGMPLSLMALYGSAMILIVLILRGFLKNKLPKPIFPFLWTLVLIRLLVPFSLSSPLSVPVPELNFLNQIFLSQENTAVTVVEDSQTAANTTENLIPGRLGSGAAAAEVITTDNLAAENYVTESSAAETAQSGDYNSIFYLFQLIDVRMLIFFIGIVITACTLLYQKMRYFRKLRDSLLVEHNETINGILRDMDYGHVLVFTNDYIASPLVTGILNPRIYLPARLEFQNIQLLKHILTHETKHIKHRDNLTKAVMLLVLCLHWYNPLVWIMSKYLSADIEAACDTAVLKNSNAEERQSYAYSLLTMAITGNRQNLLYSAFSKTEVERRIQNVLHYKKTTALVTALSIFFAFGSLVVFATGVQAPFTSYFSSYCGSDNCRWAVQAILTRDIALGDNSQKRADHIILDVMRTKDSKDPDILRSKIAEALAREFGVEKSAFRINLQLNLDDQTLESEYSEYGIGKDENGQYVYKDEPVRIYQDEMPGRVQTRDIGTVDITVNRDRLGQIISVTAWHKGDSEYDKHTEEDERVNSVWTTGSEISGAVAQVIESSQP
ncbi:M56 family metallopeptidase [Anaerocolumna sp. MB42-C2]|uniref:M56 family metallopeptidase n=1 Tax=Anaerocolumna sp. MB42-C2 TaxID=3070997 RepID=UPI0027DF8544|nr:M56 family metallopeptidase [Anaerocolumna sp. MB42-C2]WMJ89870.1 M56 family metallopeptidase [Anaerocolumna sp. MB42-C2]